MNQAWLELRSSKVVLGIRSLAESVCYLKRNDSLADLLVLSAKVAQIVLVCRIRWSQELKIDFLGTTIARANKYGI